MGQKFSKYKMKNSNSIKDNMSANYGSKKVKQNLRENKSGIQWKSKGSYTSKNSKTVGNKTKSISQNKYYVNDNGGYMTTKSYKNPVSSTNYLERKKNYSPKRGRSNQGTPSRYVNSKKM